MPSLLEDQAMLLGEREVKDKYEGEIITIHEVRQLNQLDREADK